MRGECRCCHEPIAHGNLACPQHWRMLPKPLRDAINATYQKRMWRAYVANVREADRFWEAKQKPRRCGRVHFRVHSGTPTPQVPDKTQE